MPCLKEKAQNTTMYIRYGPGLLEDDSDRHLATLRGQFRRHQVPKEYICAFSKEMAQIVYELIRYMYSPGLLEDD